MIKDFKLIYNEIDGETVFDKLPCAVSWTFDNKQYLLECKDKIIAAVLESRKEIAIIVAPFSLNRNKAFIINGDESIKWNVGNIFNVNKQMDRIFFVDVYYVLDELNFFINEKNSFDFRFSFDANSGEMGDLIQCK